MKMPGKFLISPLTPEILRGFKATDTRFVPSEVLLNYPAYAVIRISDQKALGIGGIIDSGNGMFSTWSALDAEYSKYPVTAVKCYKMLHNACVDEVKRKYSVRRIQCFVDDNPGAIRLNESLGFEIEGRLKSFYDYGKDALIAGMVIYE